MCFQCACKGGAIVALGSCEGRNMRRRVTFIGSTAMRRESRLSACRYVTIASPRLS